MSILSSPVPVLPEQLISEAAASGKHAVKFLVAEKNILEYSLLWSLAVILFAVAIYFTGKYLLDRASSAWKILRVIWLPVMMAATLTGIVIAFNPVIRQFPPPVILPGLKIYYTLIVVAATWAMCRWIGLLNHKLRTLAARNDNNLDDLTVNMLGNSIKTAVVLLAFLFIGQNIFGFKLTALLASAGVIGLALALAAKDTVSNFFGTLVIITDAPFRTGDRIACGEINGIVLSVGMRSSRILLDDETVCTVPNSILTNAPLKKINSRGTLKLSFTLQMVYQSTEKDILRAEKILHEVLDNFHGKDIPGLEPHIFFAGFGEYSLNIRVIMWLKCTSFADAETLTGEINYAILRKFNSAGLTFAYPTNTLFMENSH